MRVSVTLVDPHLDTRHDLVIEADDSTPTGEVLAAMHGMVDGVEAEEPRVISLSSRRLKVQGAGSAPVTRTPRPTRAGTCSGTSCWSGPRCSTPWPPAGR